MTDDTIDAPDVAERRRPGRPKGLPKTGGRVKGQTNLLSRDLKEMILKRGRPVELLCDVARGLRIRVGEQAGPAPAQFEYPTLSERIAAAKTLLGKIIPDVKAVEMSGPDGGPIQTEEAGAVAEAREEALRRLGEALRAGRPEPDASRAAGPRVVEYKPAAAAPVVSSVPAAPDAGQVEIDHRLQEEERLALARDMRGDQAGRRPQTVVRRP